MKEQQYHIYLFRHGQTTYNRDGKFTGHLNAKLTTKGKKHAKNIAKQLKHKTFKIAIHTSLSRSKDTLKPTLQQHPECKTILTDDRMIERGYGILEGTTHEQFIKRIGTQEYNLLIHGDALVGIETENKKVSSWIKNFLGTEEYKTIHRGYNIAVPQGESFADVEKRVKTFIKDLKTMIKKEKTNIAISAHGNSIRLFRKIMEQATMEQATTWSIPYDHVYTYKV